METEEPMSSFTIDRLEKIIAERAASGDADSWTARLVSAGMAKAARKFGEESVETMVAALTGDRDAIVAESADLLYHWLVVLKISGISLEEVMAELERRTGQSGLAEKRSRTK